MKQSSSKPETSSSGSPADALVALVERYPDVRRAVVGFSGGPDSTALLYLAARHLRPRWQVDALHVHHGLQHEADEWAQRCQALCSRLDVPVGIAYADIPDVPGESLEANARQARYAAAAEGLDAASVFLTGHHRDDQAETLLIQLLRGSGPRGLAGMPFERPLGGGRHLRPWLAFPRSELQSIAEAAGLDPIADPMNVNDRFLRSRIRGELLPILESIQPGIAGTLARTAELNAGAVEIITWVTRRELGRLIGPDSEIDLAGLRDYPAALRAELLRAWLTRLELPLPHERQLSELLRQSQARSDAEVCVRWPGAEVRRYRDRLYAASPSPSPGRETRLEWSDRELRLPAGAGRLRWEPVPGGACPEVWPRLEVRFRTGGEAIRLAGESHRRSLKKLYQERGIPPWERERLPLIYEHDELIGVADLWCGQRLESIQSRYGVRLRYRSEAEAEQC